MPLTDRTKWNDDKVQSRAFYAYQFRGAAHRAGAIPGPRFRAQVEDELREAIRSGRLAPDALLPSTRALAADLGVTRGVIVAAYDQMVAEGYLAARPGSGTVVNTTTKNPTATRPRPRHDTEIVVDFRPGLPDLDLFPRAVWLRATRTRSTLPGNELGYTDPRGLPQLREAVADYLGRVRGVSTDSDHVVVCNGFAHGLGLVVRALHDTGHDVFAVENPATPTPAPRSSGWAHAAEASTWMPRPSSWTS